jgi:hypothetical protein
MKCDYRVRTHILSRLQDSYSINHKQPSTAKIAFQIAFCYHVGFGVKSDAAQSEKWPKKANKRQAELEGKKEVPLPLFPENEMIRSFQSDGFLAA